MDHGIQAAEGTQQGIKKGKRYECNRCMAASYIVLYTMKKRSAVGLLMTQIDPLTSRSRVFFQAENVNPTAERL
jgi:hypothetical protein